MYLIFFNGVGMEDFDHNQVKDKVEKIQNGRSASGSTLLTQCCQMFVKLSGAGPLVTLSGGSKCLCSQCAESST